MKELRYNIQKDDLFKSKFPYAKVLQARYSSPEGVSTTYLRFKNFIGQALDEGLRKETIEDINIIVYCHVEELKQKYPDDFEVVGFYTKKLLIEAYIQGLLVLNGEPLVLQGLVSLAELSRNTELRKLREAEKKEREAKLVLLQEEINKHNSLRESTAVPIQEGNIFKNRILIEESFAKFFPKNANMRVRKDIIKEYIAIEYISPARGKKVWEVKQVFKPGGVRYMMEKRDFEKETRWRR
jgi:hypothetical protein